MRPGQETPDKQIPRLGTELEQHASMRPGQETPDKVGGVTLSASRRGELQ